MDFWDEHEEQRRADAIGSGSQDDTSGVCAFCGLASDDVILGVCRECGELTAV